MSKSIYIAGHKGMVGSSILKKISNEYPEYNIILRTKKELNLLNQSKVCKFFKENHMVYPLQLEYLLMLFHLHNQIDLHRIMNQHGSKSYLL